MVWWEVHQGMTGYVCVSLLLLYETHPASSCSSPSLQSGRESWGCLVVTGYPAVKLSPSKAVLTLLCVECTGTRGNHLALLTEPPGPNAELGALLWCALTQILFFFLVVAATKWPCGSPRWWRIRWASSSSHSCARPGACCSSSLDLAEVSTTDVKSSRFGYHCVFYTAMM